MKQFLRTIRDGIQRTLFDQELAVLETLQYCRDSGPFAQYGGWMTYVEVSYIAGGHKVSTDNALTVLYRFRDELEPPLVDFTIKRDGEVGSYWRINEAGRAHLEKR